MANASVNEHLIIGNLGVDPKLKEFPDGGAICEMSVATNHNFVRANGEKVEKTTFHRVLVYGKAARACATYLAKGRQVYVRGRSESRKYTVVKDGVSEDKWITELHAAEVKFLAGGQKKQQADGTAQRETKLTDAPAGDEMMPEMNLDPGPAQGEGDEIPF